MTPDWSPLDHALRQQRQSGKPLPLWWRDDDAVTATPALDKLANLSAQLALPVHIAVIPAHADKTLAHCVADRPNLIPMVHGWCHQSHSPTGQKNAEFNHPRADATAELGRGIDRLHHLFGARLLPIFVPPWNRLNDIFLPDLAAIGYTGVSTFTPRVMRLAAPGLVQINTHIDPINWKGDRSLVAPQLLIQQTADALHNRLTGQTDSMEPMGFLTHHMVHDSAVWNFTQEFLARLLDGGATSQNLDHQRDALP